MAAAAVLACIFLFAWLADGNRPRWLQIGAGVLLVACMVFVPTVLGGA